MGESKTSTAADPSNDLPADADGVADVPDRRRFLTAAVGGGVAILAAPVARLTPGPPVATFKTDDADPAIRVISTGDGPGIDIWRYTATPGSALGANQESDDGDDGYAIVAKRLGAGGGSALAALREGSGGGPAIWAYHGSTADGHGIVVDHDTGDGQALVATRAGPGSGNAIVAERTGTGDGWGLGVFNSTTAEGHPAAVIGRHGAAGGNGIVAERYGTGNGAAIVAYRDGQGGGPAIRGEAAVGLSIVGRSQFSTVGSGSIASGAASAAVVDGAALEDSHIMVVLTEDPGGASVSWVERANGSFTVHLTSAVAEATGFTYFIVETASP